MKNEIKRVIQYILHGIPTHKITANIYQLAPSGALKGKRIMITGGSKGLGFYIAQKCIAEGANVLITGRNETTLKVASSNLNNCKYLVFDISQISKIPFFFQKAQILLGGTIDCLVNNAGISLHEGNYRNVTPNSFDLQLSINLKAPYFISQEYLNQIELNGLNNGSIIFITSERGLYGDDIPYGLIKASINKLTQGLARRVLNKGIRVNAVAPGVTASEMTGYEREGNLYRPQACGKRVFLPEEVAETVCFLLSDAAKCISGEIIACDQGNYLISDW